MTVPARLVAQETEINLQRIGFSPVKIKTIFGKGLAERNKVEGII